MPETVSPKYAKVITRIQSGTMSRAELSQLKRNAEEKLKQGDADAQQVLDAMDVAVPDDAYILFMGFCPDAAFSGRLDIEWKEKGICRFDWPESAHQQERCVLKVSARGIWSY